MYLNDIKKTSLITILDCDSDNYKLLEDDDTFIKFELIINPYEYWNEFIVQNHEKWSNFPEITTTYKWTLKDIFLVLKDNWVIKSFKRKVIVPWSAWLGLDKIDQEQLLFGTEEWFHESIISEYNKDYWTFIIEFNKFKAKLLLQIIRQERKYICKLKTLRFLEKFVFKNIEYDEFIDYMDIDENYIFNDWKLQIYAIASSNRKELAKMYYYFFNHMNEDEQSEFIQICLEFESEVVSSRNYNFNEEVHTEWIGIFFYDPNKDSEFLKLSKFSKNLKWDISYDFITQQLTVKEKYIPFKWSKSQKALIECLINNSHRHISSSEIKWFWVKNLKQTLDDIRNKMEAKWVTIVQRKMLFNYFTENGEEYCRILL